MRYAVAKVHDIQPGQMKTVLAGNTTILLGRTVTGEFFALRNICPHKGAELVKGSLGDTMAAACDVGEYKLERKGEILRCPWHSWEFDIKTGCSLTEPDEVKVRTYQVLIEDETVLISK